VWRKGENMRHTSSTRRRKMRTRATQFNLESPEVKNRLRATYWANKILMFFIFSSLLISCITILVPFDYETRPLAIYFLILTAISISAFFISFSIFNIFYKKLLCIVESIFKSRRPAQEKIALITSITWKNGVFNILPEEIRNFLMACNSY
jgi:hypothetical protein